MKKFYTSLLLSLVIAQGATAAPSQGPQKAAALPVCWCNVVGADSWTGRYTAYGVYSLNPVAGFSLNKLKTDVMDTMNGNGGAVKIGNRYYLQSWAMGLMGVESELMIWDTDTWELVDRIITDDAGLQATDLAYDANTGICYGAFYNSDQSGFQLGTIKFDGYTPKKTVIGDIPLMVAALAVNSKGEVYGICEDGVLYQFNTKTAEMTRIGDTGVKVGSFKGAKQQSGEFDQHTDIFYWASLDAYGESKLYTVNVTDASVEAISEIPDHSRILNMQFMPREALDKAPNALIGFAPLYPQGNLAGKVSFTAPADCYDGSSLTETLTYHIVVNGTDYTGTTTAGAAVEKPITVAKGMTHFEAWVENSVGKSPVSSMDIWTGQDVPVLNGVNYVADGRKSTVSWSINETGLHGGYVGNPAYDVTRMPDKVKVASATSATSLTDQIPQDAPLSKYYYVVTPYNDGEKGESMTSNSNIVGDALEPPYYQPFEDASSFNTVEVIDANTDDFTWEWAEESMFNEQGVAKLSLYSDESYGINLDEWLLTPEIHLEAGKSYKVSFRAATTTGSDNMEVRYGTGLEVSKYKNVMPEVNITQTGLTEYTGTIVSDKDQKIRVGFHVKKDNWKGVIKLDDIRVSAGASDTAPAACENLEVTAAPEGALKATVKFTTPSTDVTGAALASISKVSVYCDETLVKEIENPAVGASVETEVAVPGNGFHTFKVIASNGSGTSAEATATQFVGLDVPGAFKASLEDRGDNILVKWEKCVIGNNGYYVNPDNIKYDIYEAGVFSLGDVVAQDLTGTEYAIPYNTDNQAIGIVSLAILAKNEAGNGPAWTLPQLAVGKPYQLPYSEHFDSASGYVYDGNMNQFFNIGGDDSSDGDGTAFRWIIPLGDSERDLNTMKIKISGENPTLSFDTKLPAATTLEVYAVTPDMTEYPLTTLQGSEGYEWNTSTISLKDYTDQRYVRIKFLFKAGDTQRYATMVLDNMHIIDAIDHDLALTDLILPEKNNGYGQHADFTVKVTNLGLIPAKDFSVSFYANDNLIETQSGSELEYTKSATFVFSCELLRDYPSILNVRAQIDYAPDMKSDNNVISKKLEIKPVKVSAPENLTGSVDSDNSVSLAWEAPSKFYSENVTEGFESFEPWTISAFAPWTVLDGDKAPVIYLDANYPNMGKPQAFTIIDSSSVNDSDLKPHAGTKSLGCFTADIMETDANDDWIISPLLTGEAQTISFFAKQYLAYYNPEQLEVLYSTEGTAPEDFTLIEKFEISNDMSWKKFKVQLPEGAKHFALHVVTSDGYICMIDDISYTAGSCTDIVGWRVYRDGQMIGETPAEQRNYVDNQPTANSNYNVTALYATGEESGYSNSFSTAGSSVNAIDAQTLYNVYSIDGRVIRLNAESLKDLDPGLYIVNGKKVLIRQ